ncbi:PAS domain S-box-containing protein [Mucilaginibacter sp. OK268]|uniref:PAS domain-containing protein n=1 Tax=Mucilaginibacter sp. OK268 TaxID=1881048 RepID=UPI00088699BA|nr:PAS domain S-box protein [Mucilaginibacter sp. OK268]SDQ00966.1 PAS domain S-box-containing protein [Mucilaginibacter sp. OK268]
MLNHTTIDAIDCVLAYDIHEQKYLFIGPGIYPILGITAQELYQNSEVWDNLIEKKCLTNLRSLVKNLPENSTVETNYQITTPQKVVKNISDKKSLITDETTGHKILLSTIKETLAKTNCITPTDAGHSQQFLNSLIDSQTSFLIRIDTNGNYTFVNRQYLKTLGYKDKDVLGKHFSVTSLPEEAHLCENAFIECLNNPGKVVTLLHKKPDVHGNLHDTEWELISIVNENGKVCEIQGIGHDVTTKIKIEAEIRDTAQKLDTFIESITDSFFIIDNDWRFVRVNAAFEKVWGKPRAELLGKVIWDLFPLLIDTPFETAYRDAQTKQESVKFMVYFAPLNKWFRTAVYPSTEGITVFAKNVTYEMRAQEDALWTKNNLEALINNTNDKIWSVDTDNRYVYMNNAYIAQIKAMTGVAPQKGEYSYKDMGLPQEVIDEWSAYYQRALNGENYTVILESLDDEAKNPAFYEVRFNPIFASSGEIKGVGCFAHDISARLKTEQELLSQNKRMRNIASLSSHELRRPVASMLGLINIMDRENPNNPENKQIIDYLQIVSTEIDDVIRLIVDHTFTGK